MLRERLGRFLHETNVRRLRHHHHIALTRALLLYSLGRRNSKELRQLALKLRVTDELYRLKSEFIDRTFYMASLYWRVIFEYFRNCRASAISGPDSVYLETDVLHEAVSRIKTIENESMKIVCMEDARLIEGFLSLDDHRYLYRLARAACYVTPTDADLAPMVLQLQRYCSGLVNRRMRFLIKHDRGLTPHDLQTALFEAGLMTLRQYDAESNKLKLLNTAKRGAHNYFVRLIEFYTARCRSRLVRHIDGETVPYRERLCGTCAWFDVAAADGKTCQGAGTLPNHQPCRRRDVGNVYHVRVMTEAHECANCLHYDRSGPLDRKRSCAARGTEPSARPCGHFELRIGVEQFVSTTASLDAPVGEDRGGERANLVDFIADHPQYHPSDNEWLDDLLGLLPSHEARIIRITLGMPDQPFEQWLWARTQRSSSEFNDAQLARYGCEFLNIDIDSVRQLLRQYLPVASTRRAFQ
jgi:hypothetical protein